MNTSSFSIQYVSQKTKIMKQRLKKNVLYSSKHPKGMSGCLQKIGRDDTLMIDVCYRQIIIPRKGEKMFGGYTLWNDFCTVIVLMLWWVPAYTGNPFSQPHFSSAGNRINLDKPSHSLAMDCLAKHSILFSRFVRVMVTAPRKLSCWKNHP